VFWSVTPKFGQSFESDLGKAGERVSAATEEYNDLYGNYKSKHGNENSLEVMKGALAAAINAYNALPVQKCVAVLSLQLHSQSKPGHMEIATQTLFGASFSCHQHHDVVCVHAACHLLHSDTFSSQGGR
jgi:hypothetical protein